MNLEELFLSGGGILLVTMTLIQVAPIKVNPWSTIAKAVGRAINGEVIAKVEQLERDLEGMKEAQEEITNYERYCDSHPNFENNTTVLTSQRIKDIYENCLKSADFL